MRESFFVRCVVAAVWLFAGSAFASDFYVYPAKDQSQQQMQKDEYDCQQWATGQSGFDPLAAPPTAPPPPQQAGATGQVLGGAALGAIIGGIANDNPGGGAAWGAGAGLLGRAASQRSAGAKYQQQSQAVASQYAAARGSYNNAYSACLSGRGYTLSPK